MPCVFCSIIDGSKTDQKVIERTDDFLVIEDIRPHSENHLLVIPEKHVGNPATLTAEHIPMVQRMIQWSKGHMEKEGWSEEETLVGFHWPPLITVQHLHMHVIYPRSAMAFIYKTVIFKTGFYFVTPAWLIEHIEKKENKAKKAQL